MNSPQSLWNLFAAFLGGGTGATLFAYFAGYFGEKGQHRASYEDIDNLLATKFAEAERSKAGDLQAVHKDLQNLIERTAQITTVQSQIQAEINGDLWIRQMVWARKVETYTELRKLTTDTINRAVELQGTLSIFENATPESKTAMELKITEQGRAVAEMLMRVVDSLVQAAIFVGDAGRQVEKEFYENCRIRTDGLTDCGSLINALIDWRAALARAARQDLGVDQPQT